MEMGEIYWALRSASSDGIARAIIPGIHVSGEPGDTST